MDKKLIDVKELALYLNASIPFVRKMIQLKTISYYKVGGKIMFDMRDVNNWLDKQKQEQKKDRLFF